MADLYTHVVPPFTGVYGKESMARVGNAAGAGQAEWKFPGAAAINDVVWAWPIPEGVVITNVTVAVSTSLAAATADIGFKRRPSIQKPEGVEDKAANFPADDPDYWLDGVSLAAAGGKSSLITTGARPITFRYPGYYVTWTQLGAAATAAAPLASLVISHEYLGN